MADLTVLLVPIIVGLFWIGIAAPAILRSFGVPLGFGFWPPDRRTQRLSRAQYVWAFGVFSWGFGVFLFEFLFRYLEWRLLGDSFTYPTPRHIIVGLAVWLLFGWLMGVLSLPKGQGSGCT